MKRLALILFLSLSSLAGAQGHEHSFGKWFIDTESVYLPPAVMRQCAHCGHKQAPLTYFAATWNERARDPGFWNRIEKDIIRDANWNPPLFSRK